MCLGKTSGVDDLEKVGKRTGARRRLTIIEIVDELRTGSADENEVREDDGSLWVLSTICHEVVQCSVQSFTLVGRVDTESTPYVANGISLDCERGGYPELTTTSSQGFGKIWLSCGVHIDDRAISHDSLPADDVVSRKTMLSTEEGKAAA